MYSYTAYILHVQCTVPSKHTSLLLQWPISFFCSEILVSDLKMCK